jgi:hypothetical protein
MGASGSKQEEDTLNSFSLNENSNDVEVIPPPETHLKFVKIWFFLSFLKKQLLSYEKCFICLRVDSFNSYMEEKLAKNPNLLNLLTFSILEDDFITTNADDISVYLKHLQITEKAVEKIKLNSFYKINNDFYIMFSENKLEWWYDFEAYKKFIMPEISVH